MNPRGDDRGSSSLRRTRQLQRITSRRGLARRDEIYPPHRQPDRAERTHRQAPVDQLSSAEPVPGPPDLCTFVFAGFPVERGSTAELATGAFLDVSLVGSSSAAPAPKDPFMHRRRLGRYPRPRQGRFFNLVDHGQPARAGEDRRSQRSPGREPAALRSAIIIDELGYLPFSQPGGGLLFHLIGKPAKTPRC